MFRGSWEGQAGRHAVLQSPLELDEIRTWLDVGHMVNVRGVDKPGQALYLRKMINGLFELFTFFIQIFMQNRIDHITTFVIKKEGIFPYCGYAKTDVNCCFFSLSMYILNNARIQPDSFAQSSCSDLKQAIFPGGKVIRQPAEIKNTREICGEVSI